MNDMEVIPVIDIMNGVVVHAIRGERKNYAPVKSVLCKSSNPLEIGNAFRSFGFEKIYIADLDLIEGKGNNYEVIRALSKETGLKLMVDAGIRDMNSAVKLSKIVDILIIGTETLKNIDFLVECLRTFGQKKIVVSVDIKNGCVISSSQKINMKDPLEVVLIFERIGVRKMIVLDLTRVGSKEGPNWKLLSKIINNTNIEIITGGGIRDINDLIKLKKLGISGVLIASSLHDGSIRKEDINTITGSI